VGENPFYKKHLISLDDLTLDGINYILAKGHELRTLEHNGQRFEYQDRLKNKFLIKAFFENSTRTRGSHETAGKELGMKIEGFASDEGTSIKKGESLVHTLRTFQSFHGCVAVVRHHLEGSLRAASEHLLTNERLNMSLINAGDGSHEHPTQALLDLLAIDLIARSSRKPYDAISCAFVGDNRYGRTVHSLAPVLARKGVNKITFVNPEPLTPPHYLLKRLDDLGVDYTIETELGSLLYDQDFAYVTRIQEERIPDTTELTSARRALHVTEAHIHHTPDHFRILHPLPINKHNRGIHPELDDHPKTGYWAQMEEGVFMRKALLLLLRDEQYGQDFDGNGPWEHCEETLSPRFKQPRNHGQYVPKSDAILGTIDDGVVFDHIPCYLRGLVEEILPRAYGRFSLSASGMVSPTHPDGKDLVKVSNFYPGDDILAQIAAVMPGITVSFIKGGQIIEKYQLQKPNLVERIFACVNTACITHPLHDEHIPSRHRDIGKDLYQCSYCDHITPRDTLARPVVELYLPTSVEIEKAKRELRSN